MRNKKMTPNPELEEAAMLDDSIPAFLGSPLDPGMMTVPNGSLGRHVALEMKLERQRPKEMTPEQTRRFRRMVRARVVADGMRDGWRGQPRTNLAVLRGETLSVAGTISASLQVHGRSRVLAVARQATAVRDKLIPRGVKLTRLTPEEVWVEVDKMRRAIAKDPDLLAELTRFVPEATVQALSETVDRLGEAGGMGDTLPAEVQAEARAQAHDYLVRKMNAYLLSIAASADDEDAASLEVARVALRPVADFRAVNARRKARLAARTEDEGLEDEAEEEDEEEDEDEGVVAAPVAAGAAATGAAGGVPG